MSLLDKNLFKPETPILNFAQFVEIRTDPIKGRGLYATKSIPSETLVIAEQPIAVGEFSDQAEELGLDLKSQVQQMVDVGGIQAARIASLTDGSAKPIPELSLFLDNHNQQEEQMKLSSDQVAKIITFNAYRENWDVNG